MERRLRHHADTFATWGRRTHIRLAGSHPPGPRATWPAAVVDRLGGGRPETGAGDRHRRPAPQRTRPSAAAGTKIWGRCPTAWPHRSQATWHMASSPESWRMPGGIDDGHGWHAGAADRVRRDRPWAAAAGVPRAGPRRTPARRPVDAIARRAVDAIARCPVDR